MVLKQVPSATSVPKLSLFFAAVFAVLLAAPIALSFAIPFLPSLSFVTAHADFLMCRESDSDSLTRRELASSLLRYLARNPDSELRLTVLENDEPNAFALQHSEIILTTALFDALRSSEEEAFVLGHEIGHIRAGTRLSEPALVSSHTPDDSQLLEEEAADRYAANLMEQRGMDGSAGIHLLARLSASISSSSLPRRGAALSAWMSRRGHG